MAEGKGIRISSLSDGADMPGANCTTPADGNERAQVIPLLDVIGLRAWQLRRPVKRLRVIATAKGYDANHLRQQLRQSGIWAQIHRRVWKTRNHMVDRS